MGSCKHPPQRRWGLVSIPLKDVIAFQNGKTRVSWIFFLKHFLYILLVMFYILWLCHSFPWLLQQKVNLNKKWPIKYKQSFLQVILTWKDRLKENLFNKYPMMTVGVLVKKCLKPYALSDGNEPQGQHFNWPKFTTRDLMWTVVLIKVTKM